MSEPEGLIPKHGGYRRLKSFRLARLIYDLTARFCELYVDRHSRTYDQMIQAARSGVQNIAEGSQASATSKKTELKLTNVARASLEELRLDYEDFLRHKTLPLLEGDHPILTRFKARKCATLKEVQEWAAQEQKRLATNRDIDGQTRTGTDLHGRTQTKTSGTGHNTVTPAALAANATLSLINICGLLLDRQIKNQADAFERDGGFTERLYRTRMRARKNN